MNYVLLGRFFLLEGLRFVFLVGGDEKRPVGERRGATPRRTLLVRLKGQPQALLREKRGGKNNTTTNKTPQGTANAAAGRPAAGGPPLTLHYMHYEQLHQQQQQP